MKKITLLLIMKKKVMTQRYALDMIGGGQI